MPDGIFSSARLRGYRLLEDAGVAAAVDLQVTNTLLAAQLWLPYSLIEIGFRNSMDSAISEKHDAGQNWLLADPGAAEVLDANVVACPASFQSIRPDGSIQDPIEGAARMAASQLQRDAISRDDLIAHLMLGFWVNRCPHALAKSPGLDAFALTAARLPNPLNDPLVLRTTMKNHVLEMRNRVAHHEPLLFRKRHLFLHGEPRTVGDMVGAVIDGAFPGFRKEVRIAVDTATAIVPEAAVQLALIPPAVDAHLEPLEKSIRAVRDDLRSKREERMQAQRAEKGIEPQRAQEDH